jgi:membrane dipeptidase
VVTAIDHVCQIAGDARHAGIGTDFDGGFGMKSTPAGFDTVAQVAVNDIWSALRFRPADEVGKKNPASRSGG